MDAYLLPVAALVGGIVLLVQAGDRLVHHSARVAVHHRVPKAVVGAVILGFGTSLPELFVSLTAAIQGSPDIAIANVVGSNIANVGLILGCGALVVALPVSRSVVRSDLPFGVLATLFLLLWVGPAGRVSRVAGGILLVAFVAYLWNALRVTRSYRGTIEEKPGDGEMWDLVWIGGGLVGLALGANLLVWGAVEIARLLWVSERVIGLSLVAFGTSLPELAAMVAAARRDEAAMAVGNVVGSNLFNVLFVLGTTAVVKPVPVIDATVDRDFPAVAVFSVLAFPLLSTRREITRIQGEVLLGCFVAYLIWVWAVP